MKSFFRGLPWFFSAVGLAAIGGLLLALSLKVRIYDNFGVSKDPLIVISIWEYARDFVKEKLGMKPPGLAGQVVSSLVKVKVGF